VPRLALLLKANANRVYGASAPGLAAAELAVIDRAVLGGVVSGTAPLDLGGLE
jgi:hypothetical protein